MINLIYVAGGLLLLFLGLQVGLRMRGWLRKGRPAPKVNGRLGQGIGRGEKLLAYFYSPACSACRMQEKNLAAVQERFQNVFKINAAKDMQTAREFGVMGTPTTVIIEQGIIRGYFVGVTPAAKILHSLGVS